MQNLPHWAIDIDSHTELDAEVIAMMQTAPHHGPLQVSFFFAATLIPCSRVIAGCELLDTKLQQLQQVGTTPSGCRCHPHFGTR